MPRHTNSTNPPKSLQPKTATLDKGEVLRHCTDFSVVFGTLDKQKKIKGEITGCCPFPDHEDKNPSFSYNVKTGRYRCFSCGRRGDAFSFIQETAGGDFPHAVAAVADLVGYVPPVRPQRKRPEPPVHYIYKDAAGNPVHRSSRKTNPTGKRSFVQARWDGKGWFSGTAGVDLLPYGLNRFAGALDEIMFIPEGEKDCETLWNHGLQASTNVGGAGNWQAGICSYFTGRRVVILPDNDEPGERHAKDVLEKLTPFAREAKIIHLPDLPDKGDVSDWLEAGHTIDDLLLHAAKVAPPPVVKPAELPELEVPILINVEYSNMIDDALITDLPGMLGRVIDYTMTNAPRPNLMLSFAGAMALASLLAGRRFTLHGTCPNLYLCALGPSGVGKEAPRAACRHLLDHAGASNLLAGGFASGEAIQDRLLNNPRALAMIDEISFMFSSMKGEGSSKVSIPAELNELFTGASGPYPTRDRAGAPGDVIDRPHLALLATGVTQDFFESLSRRLAVTGFLPRLLVVEASPRAEEINKQLNRWGEIPAALKKDLASWTDGVPAGGPTEIQFTADAQARFEAGSRGSDVCWKQAEASGDDFSCGFWARVPELATKLALLYQLSVDDGKSSLCHVEAIDWGYAVAETNAAYMVDRSTNAVSDNPYHATQQKVLRLIKKHRGRHRDVLHRSNMKAADLAEIVATLVESETITVGTTDTGGKKYIIIR